MSMMSSYVFSSIRFLNACTCTQTLCILVDNIPISSSLAFGKATEYVGVTLGTHTITIRQSRQLRRVLYSQSVFFSGSEHYTFVLTENGKGMELTQVSDKLHESSEKNAYYRVANFSYDDSDFRVRFASAQTNPCQTCTSCRPNAGCSRSDYTPNTLFAEGLSYRTITKPTPLCPGTYRLILSGEGRDILDYSIKIQPETLVTTYFIGNPWCIKSLLAVTLS